MDAAPDDLVSTNRFSSGTSSSGGSSSGNPATRYAAEREVAVEAAQEAAGLTRRRAGAVGAEAVRAKGTHDYVTEVDDAAQQRIVGRLRRAFPNYAVLAEEGADVRAVPPRAEGHRWIVDPIDGTTNFMHGVPPYAVSIALQREAQIVVGVVLDVAGGDLYTAIRGGGLHVNGAPAGVSAAAALAGSLLATGFPYRNLGHVEDYLHVLGRLMRTTRGVRRHGSAAVDLARVACGRFGGFFETGLDPWDVAAGLLLVEEGGGRVTDYRGAANPVFAHQMLASNGRIHDALLDALAPMQHVRG